MKDQNKQNPQDQLDQEAKPKNSVGKKGLRIMGKAVGFSVDVAAGTVSTVFKIIGTVLLILLVSGMMFA
jgi:hypothetical protein